MKAIAGVTDIETDLDEQTCSFKVATSVNVDELLNDLAENNNKISAWEFVE